MERQLFYGPFLLLYACCLIAELTMSEKDHVRARKQSSKSHPAVEP
jgi:hypothetical protein